MEFYKKPMALFALVLALLQLSMTMGAVYKVGDSVGWTTIGSPDYKKWASSKTFHIGDTIVFTYNTQFHNVMQVSHSDFSSCNVSAPIATHTTGNDSIAIKKSGHYYYVCGVPGHCQSGQKVDIRVLAAGASPTAAPSPAGSSPATSSGTSPPDSVAPVPSPKNTATLPSTGFFGPVALVLAVFAGFGF